MAYAPDYFGHDTPKLGFGMMRLPKLEDGSMDIKQICEMVDVFMDAGLTYFDTAYVYDDGESEIATRKALIERYPRDKFTVTTKANAWLGRPTAEQTKEQLRISMERLGVDYLDYYLLHAIQDNNKNVYEEYGLFDWVRDLKEQGIIKHYGFSFHAGADTLDELLKAHPDVDFIQLQINYADWNNPSVQSRAIAEVAEAHGVPYTIMEPIKGGLLATPVPQVAEVFDAAGKDLSYAGWAVRFAASQPGVLTVLSGMSTLEQVQDNVSYMRDFTPMTAEELAVVAKAREVFESIEQVECTACHYCCEGCPVQIPIPDIFKAYNRKLQGDAGAHKRYVETCEKAGVSAEACIQCGQCEGACPQNLPIIELLAKAHEALA